MSSTTPSAIQPTIMAVIELGSTSIRMAVAELRGGPGGKPRILDSLQQTLSLGRDTFTTGAIGRQTTEACVSAVISFRRVMSEYGIQHDSQIRAIATSAVREAANRDAFLDRMVVATGIRFAVTEEAEINRLTYRAVRPVLGSQAFFRRSDTLVVEVGGGSTEALMFHRGRVTRSHMYRLGSLRLAKSVSEFAVSHQRELDLMRESINETVMEIRESIMPANPLVMMVLGADIRFAAAQIHPDWDRKKPIAVRTEVFDRLVDRLVHTRDDDMVSQFHLSYEDAETIRPALLIYSRLAAALHVRQFFVAEVNLRSGLLAEMSAGGNWTPEFKRQIISSALEIARHYRVDLVHARQVCAYAMDLFHYLEARYAFGTREEMILTVAALLHEIGQYVGPNSHHKHTYYLLSNSEVFGLGRPDVELAALVARYHRRSPPKPSHGAFMQQSRDDRLIVSKLAAILRVANALDAMKARQRRSLRIQEHAGALQVITNTFTHLDAIQRRVAERADLFEQIFGMPVVIRQKDKDPQRHA